MAEGCITAGVSSGPEGQDSLRAYQGTRICVEPETCKCISICEGDAVLQSDDFNMYHYKVQICPKGCTPLKWGTCGYAHHGEKARRRDPRLGYISIACPDMLKSGKCPRGDACGMAHSAFEFWLHPQRYRTEICRDGESCLRSVCFFAHNQAQLRKAEYPTTDTAGNPLPRPKFSLSALKTQQPQVAAAAATTSTAGKTAQQVLRQTSSCSYSTGGSLDSACSAFGVGALSEQRPLQSYNHAVLGHNRSSGSYEVSPMLPAPAMQFNRCGMPNAACLASPTAYSGSSSSSPACSGFTYLPPGSTHLQYNGTYCGGSNGNCSGIPGPVTGPVGRTASVLLPALLENLSSTQQQAQLAQQAANAANGQLAALYQALGISNETAGSSSNSSSLCMPACSPVADAAHVLSPAVYGIGYGSDISIGGFSSGQLARLSSPPNSEGLLLNDTGSVQSGVPVMSALPVTGYLQPMTSLVPGNVQMASATQALLPPIPTRTAASAAATGSCTAMYVSSLVPQAGCGLVASAVGHSRVLPAQQQQPALTACGIAAMQQQGGQWGDTIHAAQMCSVVLPAPRGLNWV